MDPWKRECAIWTPGSGGMDLLTPHPNMVNMVDIADSLERIYRWNGHTNVTVAHHSLIVANACPWELRLCALLHDAAEAYVGDLPTPLKKRIFVKGIDGEVISFSEMEHEILLCIYDHLKVEYDPRDMMQVLYVEKSLLLDDRIREYDPNLQGKRWLREVERCLTT